MKVAAIIAEYNPLHNGHAYQINYIKETLGADYVIVLMSGDFVERGEPSVVTKEIRTEMALNAGADCVMLLPFPYATSSADLFAYGAVSILNRLGCVDMLVFGSECGDISKLSECADVMMNEGTINSPKIREKMKEGNTFAKARALLFPEFNDILSKSNNILAVEYLVSLKLLNSTITPVTIMRKGSDYNDILLPENDGFASATAIRDSLFKGCVTDLSKFLPEYSFNAIKELSPISLDDFTVFYYYKDFELGSDQKEYYEVSGDLLNTLKKNVTKAQNISELVSLCKSKNYTEARIKRGILHILMDCSMDYDTLRNGLDSLQYVRLLGLKKDSSEVLSAIKEKGTILNVSKVPDVEDEFNEFTKTVFDMELRASTLYDRVFARKNKGNFTAEYSKKFLLG